MGTPVQGGCRRPGYPSEPTRPRYPSPSRAPERPNAAGQRRPAAFGSRGGGLRASAPRGAEEGGGAESEDAEAGDQQRQRVAAGEGEPAAALRARDPAGGGATRSRGARSA